MYWRFDFSQLSTVLDTHRIRRRLEDNSRDRRIPTTHCLAGRVLISQKSTALVIASYPNESALASALGWERSGFLALSGHHVE